MSQYPCKISNCPRLSRVLCYCCQNNFCIEHINNHHDQFMFQLHELTNEINHLIEQYRDQYRQQLDHWRHETHQAIDSYYEKKCQELDRLTIPNEKLNQNRQIIERIQFKITELIREQNITQQKIDSLKAATNAIRRELDEIPREHFQLNIPSLVFDDDFIRLERTKTYFNLHSTIQSLYSAKNLSTSNCIVMANNREYLLISQESNLSLFDEQLNQTKDIPWTYGSIWDMCRSDALSKFILVAEDGIFTLDERTMSIEARNDLIKEDTVWYSCACSDKNVFLAAQQLNTSVNEYSFRKDEFRFKRQQSCCSDHDYIEHMKCSNSLLALIVMNDITSERRFVIRSIVTFDQIWTIGLNIQEKMNIVSCCSLYERGWLIVDLAQSRLIHITNQGQIKQTENYRPTPQYAIQFDKYTLAILTEQGIHLHRIQ